MSVPVSEIINPANSDGSAGSYTVNEGDTLQGVAEAVWGDAALWYMIADETGTHTIYR